MLMITFYAERQAFIKEPRKPSARHSGFFTRLLRSILSSHQLMVWLRGVTWYARRTAGCGTSCKRSRKLHGWPGELQNWAGMTRLRSVGAGTLLRMLLVTSMLVSLSLIRRSRSTPTWQRHG